MPQVLHLIKSEEKQHRIDSLFLYAAGFPLLKLPASISFAPDYFSWKFLDMRLDLLHLLDEVV